MFFFALVVEVSLFSLIIILFNYKETYDDKDKVRPSISYDVNVRQVILNGQFAVTSFRCGSLNHLLFEYLYSNPDRKISFDELDEKILKGRHVNLNKVSDAMGFRCELKRLLFTCGSDFIIFHPSQLVDYDGVLKIT
ncbi:hypothetical protein ACVSUB_21320 [Yersinia enterocolitica]